MDWTFYMSDNRTAKQVFTIQVGSKQQAITRKAKEALVDCVEEDLHRAGISRYDITTGRQQEIAGDGSQWRELVAASTAGTSFVTT